jgi:general secretion pathway protein G
MIDNHAGPTLSQIGFTLIEIMLALAAAVILASIAIPSYQAAINKARTGQAIKDIYQIENILERYRSTHQYQLPPDLATLGAAVPLDPWGNAYEYLNIEAGAKTGKVRRDKNLKPLNSDFDLYSKGPDGETMTQLTGAKARDDIVRAGNGSFVGLASEH